MTTVIACSVGGPRKLARKIDAFLFNLDERKENLELELAAVLCRLGIDRNSHGAAGIATVRSLRHSE